MNRRIKWLIPYKRGLKTPREAKALLTDGYTLINNMGFKVHLQGLKQVKTNTNRKRDYKFTNPDLWQVLNTDSTSCYRTVLYDTESYMFKAQRLLNKFCNYMTKWL